MRKYTSPITGKEYWVTEGKITTPKDGLPVFTKREIDMIRRHKDKLTKDDHEIIYAMKLENQGNVLRLLDRFESVPTIKPLDPEAEAALKDIYKTLGKP